MGDLTRNISRHEIECRCNQCGSDVIDYQVVQAVQWACDHWALKLGLDKVVCRIGRGNSCSWHNGKIGGVRDSMHVQGKAIDFSIEGVSHRNLYDSLDVQYNDLYGLACYEWGVHIDSRSNGPARW